MPNNLQSLWQRTLARDQGSVSTKVTHINHYSNLTPWTHHSVTNACRHKLWRNLNVLMVCAVVSSVDLDERAASSIPIHYRFVHCLGEERNLTDCPGISEITTTCSHNQDAYIVCRPQTLSISRKSHFHFHSCAMFWWMFHNLVFQCFIPTLHSTYPNVPLWYCMSQPVHSTPWYLCSCWSFSS